MSTVWILSPSLATQVTNEYVSSYKNDDNLLSKNVLIIITLGSKTKKTLGRILSKSLQSWNFLLAKNKCTHYCPFSIPAPSVTQETRSWHFLTALSADSCLGSVNGRHWGKTGKQKAEKIILPCVWKCLMPWQQQWQHVCVSGFLLRQQSLMYNSKGSFRASLMAPMVKCLPAMRETRVRSLGQEDPLEKEMAIHSSTLAWKIPWMDEPGRLQSMGSQSRTRLSDFAFTFIKVSTAFSFSSNKQAWTIFSNSKFSFTAIYVYLASAKKAFISEELKIDPYC